MPRTRAHAAARIDGAECTRALQVRRRWRRRIAPRDATDAECGASACGLTPRRRQRLRRRRRRRKLLVLDTVVTRRCRVRFCVPRRWGRAFGRVGAQVRCPRRLARLRFKGPSHARSVERGARRRRPSDARSAERWLVCRVQYTSVSVRRRALSLLLEPVCVSVLASRRRFR